MTKETIKAALDEMRSYMDLFGPRGKRKRKWYEQGYQSGWMTAYRKGLEAGRKRESEGECVGFKETVRVPGPQSVETTTRGEVKADANKLRIDDLKECFDRMQGWQSGASDRLYSLEEDQVKHRERILELEKQNKHLETRVGMLRGQIAVLEAK